MISAIIPAAGSSSRFGPADKLLLPYGGNTLLGYVIEQVATSQAEEILVILPPVHRHPDYNRKYNRVRTLLNPEPQKGLTASIRIGVQAARAGRGFMICLGDMPALGTDDYNLLIDAFLQLPGKTILRPQFNSVPGNPVLFSTAFREDILNLSYPDGLHPLLHARSAHVHLWDAPHPGFITDIDTPGDYQGLV